MSVHEITFKPSPWPLIGSVVILPLVMIGSIFAFADFLVACISSVVLVVFFYRSMAGSAMLKIRTLNTLGVLNSVRLSPAGIEHSYWNWLSSPKYYKYSWNDIHSIRPHAPSYNEQMIAFTPVKAEVRKFYRSRFDGSYGVPKYGHGNKMLECMLEFHQRYATNELSSTTGTLESREPIPAPILFPLEIEPVATSSVDQNASR